MKVPGHSQPAGKVFPTSSYDFPATERLVEYKAVMDLGTRSASCIQKELSQPTVLTLYDLKAPTKVFADASSFGLGAVLLQQFGDQWKPAAYASQSMT